MIILFLMFVGIILAWVAYQIRPRTPLEWIAVIGLAIWLCGCAGPAHRPVTGTPRAKPVGVPVCDDWGRCRRQRVEDILVNQEVYR